MLSGKYAGQTYAQRKAGMLESRKLNRKKDREKRKAQGKDPYYGQIEKERIHLSNRKKAMSDGRLAHERYGLKRKKGTNTLERDSEGHIEIGNPDIPVADADLALLKDQTKNEWKQYLRQLRATPLRYKAFMDATKSLCETFPLLRLNDKGEFQICAENIRRMYDKTHADLHAEDSEIDNEKDAWQPPIAVQVFLQNYFKFRPFDKIRYGLLKVVNRDGELIPFLVNAEQEVMLEYVERRWYAKLPVFAIVLKARQIGSSTFWQAVHYCYQTTQSNKQSHIVTDLKEKGEGLLEMFNIFHENEPIWMRPKILKAKDPMRLGGNGVKNAKVRIESAERRENIARAFTFQFNHLSEIPFWPEDVLASIFNGLLKAIPKKWPCIHVEESTGRNVNDMFYTRYFEAKAEKLTLFKAFFFPWFDHAEYRTEIPRGLNRNDFIATLDEDTAEMMRRYNLDVEQVYWYVNERNMEVNSGEKNDDLFKRELPSNEDEAFLGANSNFFDVKRNKDDKERVSISYRRRVPSLSDLKKSVSGWLGLNGWRAVFPFVRAVMKTDEENQCQNPAFIVDDRAGLWTVWEDYRPAHRYIVCADSARGKETQKNISTSSDYDVCDVWRYTHEHDEPRRIVQVAQFRSKVGPVVLAQQAVAASQLYADQMDGDKRAFIIGENNSHGFAFVEEVKRLGGDQYQRVNYGKNQEEISRELGFNTTGGQNAAGAKSHLLNRFKKAWTQGYVLVMSDITANEMGYFVNKDGKLEAMKPHHDDTVIVEALAVEALYDLTGEIFPVEIRVRPDMVDAFSDDDDYEQAPKIDKTDIKRQMREDLGVFTPPNPRQRLARWI